MVSHVSDPVRMRLDAVAGSLLEDLLRFACEGLQLTPTLHGLADERYRTISELLADPSSFFAAYDPDIYPQGSFLIGTTVRPILRCEYDLDFVMQLSSATPRDPMLLLQQLEDIFKAHGTYKNMVRRLKRCVRLVYAGDFHMDILPAVSEDEHSTRILVPDRALKNWKSSNPRGFATWFQQRQRVMRFDRAASVESLPAMQSVDEKSALQRVVQLIKRARDRYVTNLELSPRSVVLTTMAGEGYTGSLSTAGAMSSVLQHLRDLVAGSHGPLRVYNPANPDELLSEQWVSNPDAYREFTRWLAWFSDEWTKVMTAERVPELKQLLSTLFGEDVAIDAIKKHAVHMEEQRKAEKLKINSRGAITAAAGVASIRSNTFYGDE